MYLVDLNEYLEHMDDKTYAKLSKRTWQTFLFMCSSVQVFVFNCPSVDGQVCVWRTDVVVVTCLPTFMFKCSSVCVQVLMAKCCMVLVKFVCGGQMW